VHSQNSNDFISKNFLETSNRQSLLHSKLSYLSLFSNILIEIPEVRRSLLLAPNQLGPGRSAFGPIFVRLCLGQVYLLLLLLML
jgi:hypothetical protein